MNDLKAKLEDLKLLNAVLGQLIRELENETR